MNTGSAPIADSDSCVDTPASGPSCAGRFVERDGRFWSVVSSHVGERTVPSDTQSSTTVW